MSTTRLRSALGLVLLLGLVPHSHAAPPLDGVWELREHFCASVNGQRRCGPGNEQLMFSDGRTYYRQFTSDEWSEIGVAGVNRGRVAVTVSREGIGRLVEHLVGVDVTDMLEDFAFTYAGALRRGRIVGGYARARLNLSVDDRTYRIRIGGSFTGRRIGDAVVPTSPEPEPFPDFAAPRGEPAGGEPMGPGVLSSVAATIQDPDER